MKKNLEAKDAIIDQLQADNKRLLTDVVDLTSRLTIVEQHMRDSNLEINGIPEHHNENLVNTFIHLTKTIGSPVTDSEILQITRVAKMNQNVDRPRSVIAKLRTPRQRDTILAAVFNYNKKNPQQKLNSSHLGIAGKCSPVYVSEHLSPTNKRLHAETRKLAKQVSYKFVWVRNGRIYVRKDEQSQAIYIRNQDCLSRIK
ncbi:unnamed protein product [Arctia plantaginis]|uniref:FP protein C-terminal domain-containing protein n=1 Tax=Arctia plantaginis TaxID=874455 RepID=A0A8S1BEK9_ARCPL|nr:unnamed protein product [Arctia plantaginis]